jgi:hypothetical protein
MSGVAMPSMKRSRAVVVGAPRKRWKMKNITRICVTTVAPESSRP